MNKTDLYIEYLINEYPNNINWNYISNNQNISIKFIKKYYDKLDIFLILQNKNVYPKHIEKWFTSDEIKKNFQITKNPNLTDEFVRKYYNDEIFTNKRFYKFIKISNKEFIANHDKITNANSFIRKYKDICDLYESLGLIAWEKSDFWDNVGFNPNITPAFIEKYEDKISWDMMEWNPSMTKEFIDNNVDKFNWDIFISNTKIPIELYKDYIYKIDSKSYQYIDTLPVKYLKNYKYLFNSWDNQNIDSKFIDANVKYVNWALLSDNTSLSLDIIKKYKDKLYWCYLLQNSFENAPDINNHIVESYNKIFTNIEQEKKLINATAYFVTFKRFNMIEIYEEESKRKYYTTNVSEETWEFLTKNTNYKIFKTNDGIKIELDDDIIIQGHKIIYDD